MVTSSVTSHKITINRKTSLIIICIEKTSLRCQSVQKNNLPFKFYDPLKRESGCTCTSNLVVNFHSIIKCYVRLYEHYPRKCGSVGAIVEFAGLIDDDFMAHPLILWRRDDVSVKDKLNWSLPLMYNNNNVRRRNNANE